MLLTATSIFQFSVDAVEEVTPAQLPWHIGRFATDVLGRIAPPCTVREWVFDFFRPIPERELDPTPDMCLTCPPLEWLQWNVLGELLLTQYAEVQKLQQARRASVGTDKEGWPRLDPDAFVKATLAGAQRGLTAAYDGWVASLNTSMERLDAHRRLQSVALVPEPEAEPGHEPPAPRPTKKRKKADTN